MLELREVSKRYGRRLTAVQAIDGVSLAVGRGEVVALFGPSGSGKTTLLQLAAGLLPPDAGEVRFEGTDLAAMSPRDGDAYRLHALGLVFQSAQLAPGASALDNAALKLILSGVGRRAARQRALPWLERLGLGPRASHHPAQLSTGERQRVAIARALAHGPKLVLADEPTGNLNTAAGHEVFETLAGIAHDHGVGVLLVTHDRGALAFADRAHDLRDGRLLAHATAPEPADPAGSRP